MHKAIISDTSCLILLDKIGELEILHKLFGTIITTTEVAGEFGQQLPSWVEIKQPSDKNYLSIIEASVDKGEASAIALAIELDDCLLIIDDLKGRKFANQIGLTIIGTIGVIVDAKLAGIIPSVKPILAKIKLTNFRITEQLEAIILKKSGEQASLTKLLLQVERDLLRLRLFAIVGRSPIMVRFGKSSIYNLNVQVSDARKAKYLFCCRLPKKYIA